MAKKRVPRSKASKKYSSHITPELPLLEQIPLSALGTDKDPCLGKHYDSREEACKMCGDSEICLVIFSDNLRKLQKLDDQARKRKDTELFNSSNKVVDFIVSKLRKKPFSKAGLYKLVKAEFYQDSKLSDTEQNKLIDSCLRTIQGIAQVKVDGKTKLTLR